MKSRKVFLILILALILILGAGCKLIPSHFEIETTSELGPNTLDRIDDINDTLATGMEIGPETRQVIDSLNDTIAEGLEFGFKPETLQRIDILLAMVEQGIGLKVGLDAETNATVNSLIDTIDDMPSQWEDTLTEIIMTLEGSTARVADELADDVAGLMVEARINTQQITASAGAEFRCNVDFMSTRAGDTIDQFIGKGLIGRLRQIFSDEPVEEDQIPTPWICQVIPDQIDLVEIGGETLFEMSVVKLSGYNFIEENKPVAYLVDGENNKLESISLFPAMLSSPYQIQLNMQGVDFSAVPYGAQLVFEWPSEGTSNSLAVVFPIDEPEPTPVVQPELTVNVATLDIKKGPSNDYFTIGIAVQGAVYEVTGHNGDQSWWQIDFENDPGWVPASAVTRNAEPIGPASSIPFDPPMAAFSMSPTSGTAALEVDIWDQSTGDPTTTSWQVISSEGPPDTFGEVDSFSYEFTQAGTYTVALYVANDWGDDELEKTITVDEPDDPLVFLPIIQIPFIPLLNLQSTPDYSTNFIFRNYTNVKAAETYVTDIPTSTYNCSIISLAALHGDIQEHDAGNVLKLWLANSGPYWTITPNFRTHRHSAGQEHWSLGLMCADKNNSKFISDIYIKPQSSSTVSINPTIYDIPSEYTCIIAGYDIKNTDVQENGAGDIIQVFARKDEDGVWQVTADFREHGGGVESWIVQMLCFYDNQSVVLTYDDPATNLAPFSIETGGYQTNISANDYACGIAGMHALDGDVNENDIGDIMRVFTYHNNSKWFVFADFRSHYQDEMWDIDLICVKRSVAQIQMNQWFGSWADP
jgi:PKD repeat protein